MDSYSYAAAGAVFSPWRGRYLTMVQSGGQHVRALPEGFDSRCLCVPEQGFNVLGALAPYERIVNVTQGTYITAVSAFSQVADGFTVQVIDRGTGSNFFSTPIHSSQLGRKTTHAAVLGLRNNIYYPLLHLPEPRLVTAPGQITVKLQNLANAANRVQICLWAVEPMEEQS